VENILSQLVDLLLAFGPQTFQDFDLTPGLAPDIYLHVSQV